MVRQRLILLNVTFDAILFSEGFSYLSLSDTCDVYIVILVYHQSISYTPTTTSYGRGMDTDGEAFLFMMKFFLFIKGSYFRFT